jgi:hypothetical protein
MFALLSAMAVRLNRQATGSEVPGVFCIVFHLQPVEFDATVHLWYQLPWTIPWLLNIPLKQTEKTEVS